MPLAIGQVIQNRYRIEALLGQGGFGAVYRAFDLNINFHVAIKENLDASPEAQRQFIREAALLVRLRHPSLPRVSDSFFIPGQGQYLVMDYIDGQDLQEMLDQHGPLDEARAVAWMGQVLDALAYLHAQNPPIIHRDVKPANIRVTPDGRAVLVDFGIAKFYDPSQKTAQGARGVSPGYSSFEQYKQRGTDARSDVYSAGATLYALLTGQEPPEAIDLVDGTAHLAPPRQINPRLSPWLEAAVLKAMSTQPIGRYMDAGQMRAALVPQVPAPVATPPQVPVPAAPRPAPQPVRAPSPRPAAVPSQGVPARNYFLVGVGAVLTIGFVIWWVASSMSGAAPPQPPTVTPLPPTAAVSVPPCTTIGQTWHHPRDNADMVCVPAGEFLMGSVNSDSMVGDYEKPQHSVYLDAFWIDRTEVTNAMFAHFVNAAGYKTDAQKEGTSWVYTGNWWSEVKGTDWQHPRGPASNITGVDNHPVVHVSWNDAQAYCQWVGRQLPTEAQWEKAARGTDGRIYPWGNQPATCEYAIMNDGSGNGCGQSNAAWAVGSRPKGASPYGAYDMAGNVWEWVADWYDGKYYGNSPARNPQGSLSGQWRVLRGGCWADLINNVRTAFRFNITPDPRGDDTGFRCGVVAP